MYNSKSKSVMKLYNNKEEKEFLQEAILITVMIITGFVAMSFAAFIH